MSKDKIRKQLSELEAEQSTLREDEKRKMDALTDIRERLRANGRQVERLRLRLLVGKQVKLVSGFTERACIKDKSGTLKEVRRSRALVDFGEAGNWTMPIEALQPANAETDTRWVWLG